MRLANLKFIHRYWQRSLDMSNELRLEAVLKTWATSF